MKRIILSEPMYRRLMRCLEFCEDDLRATEGFLEAAQGSSGYGGTERTDARRVTELIVEAERNTSEV